MREEIQHQIIDRRTRLDDSFYRFKWLLRVAPRYILVHTVKDLLDINPDVPGPNKLRIASFEVLLTSSPDFLVIAAENLWYVGVLGPNVKHRLSNRVVEQLLAYRHPVLLGAVAPLISHGN